MDNEVIEKMLASAQAEIAKTARAIQAIADVVEKLEAEHQKEIDMLRCQISRLRIRGKR